MAYYLKYTILSSTDLLKMRNLILAAATFLCLAAQSHAQNAENKNAISARLNFFDYGYFSAENKAQVSQGFELGYFRNVLPFVNLADCLS